MTYHSGGPKAGFLQRMGADLATVRKAADMTQEQVSAIVSPEKPNRDTVCKIEKGRSGVDFYRYLVLIWAMRDAAPGHPGVALARMYLSDADRESLE